VLTIGVVLVVLPAAQAVADAADRTAARSASTADSRATGKKKNKKILVVVRASREKKAAVCGVRGTRLPGPGRGRALVRRVETDGSVVIGLLFAPSPLPAFRACLPSPALPSKPFPPPSTPSCRGPRACPVYLLSRVRVRVAPRRVERRDEKPHRSIDRSARAPPSPSPPAIKRVL